MKKAPFCVAIFLTLAARAVTTGIVPAEGVFRFTFGTDSAVDGFAVPASAVYDANHQYVNTTGETFTYGFLGTTAESYKTDVPWSLPSVAYAIDGFKVVQGQSILLHDVPGKGVTGPSAAEYLPAGASPYEGRYPIRFSMSAEENAFYAVTCTVVNVSSTEPADVTLFSERCHLQAHHLTLAPDEMRTFAWSVELAPNFFKSSGTYRDDAINIVVVGKNAGLQSLVVVKQPQVAGTVRGVATEKMNVGRTMWLCDDSTGTDQRCDTPYFSLQNYSGVGSGLSRYAPANLSIRNQGEGGLATNANAHRKSCLLKPGDYLYVEYGHNESGVDSYTANLELYLADANAAGANLIIVSPLERRSSWNSETSTWNRSLQSYAEAGEAWVNAKIAAGATNVAFIDLNKRYNDWMNAELQRIHAVNPSVSLNAAISYYYRSAKGANVDNTHINNAGTDQAAYWVWYDALQRVAAGERDGATEAERVQAAVLKGITEGYQGTVGLDSSDANLPWQVTDEIINAGAAPNAFWDTPVMAGYAYAHDAAVAAVDATANADGSVTLKGVTMRILNPNNYYKAVVEVTDAAGAKTRYYSYYNYDVGGAGKLSGDLVTPEQSGFLTSDKNKADVVAADLSAVTIPVDGKAWIWFAEADAGTWQVGDNGPCSAKVPVEWWSKTLVDETCSTAENWKVLTQATYTTNIVDGVLSFTSTGADANNTKKNMGLYRALDGDVASGRYRISFKVMIDAGGFSVLLGDAVNTTTTVFKNSISLLKLDGTTVTSYQATTPSVTLSAEGVPQAKVNAGRWVDVDLIVDRDNAQAWISVGGSDYVEWRDEDFVPGSFAGLAWKYFGITTPGQMSTFGSIDDVKIQKLAPIKSTSDKYTVKTWDDFSDGDGMSFALTSSDSRTPGGLVWANSANKGTAGTVSYGKYIVFTPSVAGLVSIKFTVNAFVDKRNPTIIISEANAVSDCSTENKFASLSITSANTEYILTANLEAGKTYYVWPYSYNWSGAGFNHNYTISSIAYIYEAPVIEKVPFFITGGQSNTDGRLDGTSAGQELPSYLADGNPKALVSATTGSSADAGRFTAFAPATGAAGQPNKWAYDAVTYHLIGEALGMFYVAKTSYGGTSIDPRVGNSPSTHDNAWLADYGAGYHWSADPTFLAATTMAGTTFEHEGVTYDGQSMLKAWIANIDASIDALVAEGKEPEIKAILWHQGESDRGVASDYKANLLQMVAYVRNHLVEKTGKAEYANLPFFCGTIPFASTQGNATLDRAFLELDADEANNIHVVDIHDITLKSDNIHFSAAGAEIFGRRLYNRLVDEGVVDGEKVDEPYAVRKPDFGVEHVINNTTTWTFSEYASGEVVAGTLTDINGLYLHAENATSRGFVSKNANQTLAFTIGDATPVSITRAPYTVGRNYGHNVTALTSAGNGSSSLYTTVALNVGRAGALETFIYANKDGVGYQLYFNGAVVDEVTNTVKGKVYSLKGINATVGTYYVNLNDSVYYLGARYVPDEEMPVVTVTVPANGVTTFGNTFNASFALPEGLSAYALSTDPGDMNRIRLTPVSAVNRGDAVVLKGAPGVYRLIPDEGAAYEGENFLVAQQTAGCVSETSGGDFVNFLVGADREGNVVLTKADGSTEVPAGAAVFALTNGDAHSAKTVLYEVLPSTAYVWTGAAGDGDWANVANWTLRGETPAAFPNDPDDRIVIDGAATIFSDVAIVAKDFTIGGEVTIGGKILGPGFVKKGTGMLTLTGVFAPTGAVDIQAGDVVVDNSLKDVPNLTVDLDATDATSIVTDDAGKVTAWMSQVGDVSYTNAESQVTKTSEYFGGRTALSFNQSQLTSSFSDRSKVQTLFAAAHLVAKPGTNTGAILYRKNSSNTYVGQRNSRNDYWSVLVASSTVPKAGNYFWQNGETNMLYATEDRILTASQFYNSTSTRDCVGGNNAATQIAVGELIGLSTFNLTSSAANQVLRKRVESYLGNKWGVSGMETLPTPVVVTVAKNSTLRLPGSAHFTPGDGCATIDNGDGTQTLVARRRGLRIVVL